MDLVGYVAAILMGISLGLIGGGGSILTVPILVYFFKQDPLIATTGSLLVVGSTAIVGAFTYARRKLIDFKTGFLFAVPSFAGVFFARNLILPHLPDPIFTISEFVLTKASLVLGSFAILMVLASISMIRSKKKNLQAETKSELNILSVASRGFFVGAVTGFVGAGGGFLIIPALVLLLDLPMRVAVGTSLGIIALNSLLGFLISLGDQSIDWVLLFKITALGIVGLILGHFLSPRVDDQKLKSGFGYFVLIVGLFILIDQFVHK